MPASRPVLLWLEVGLQLTAGGVVADERVDRIGKVDLAAAAGLATRIYYTIEKTVDLGILSGDLRPVNGRR